MTDVFNTFNPTLANHRMSSSGHFPSVVYPSVIPSVRMFTLVHDYSEKSWQKVYKWKPDNESFIDRQCICTVATAFIVCHRLFMSTIVEIIQVASS